jgi:hypothetical protein
MIKTNIMAGTKSYAENIKSAEVMLSGLTNNAAHVSRRGLDETFTAKLKDDLQKAIALNNGQEKLKADLKRKTDELMATMNTLNAAVAEARKIVKIDFPKSQWTEFGIDAAR